MYVQELYDKVSEREGIWLWRERGERWVGRGLGAMKVEVRGEGNRGWGRRNIL